MRTIAEERHGVPGDAGSMRSLALVLTAWAGVAALGACGGEGSGSRTAVRDSAGVRIVENEAPDSAHMPAWSVAPAPILDVGRLEGDEAETLFRVVSAARLSDGRVAVANSGTSEVRYYDADGRHLVSAGGEGGGPGEFQRITTLIALPADSVAVVDPFARRLSVLDPSGTFAREVTFEETGSMLSVVGRRADGAWIASQNEPMSGEDIKSGLTRPDVVYVAIPPGAERRDTLGRFTGTERFINIGTTGGRITSVEVSTPPFARATTVLPLGDELFVATQDAAQVEVYGSDGALRRIIRTGVALRPVTADLVEAYLDRRYAELPPEQAKAARRAGADVPAGKSIPPYGKVALDRGGHLWIQDYAILSDENHWTVYSADGMPLARIALPPKFTPYDIGDDWILGRQLDDLEVEHVRIYEIRRESPAP